ncbi:MAG: SAM-dependent chlorinase/fluorinase [Thermoleophilia bacterium]
MRPICFFSDYGYTDDFAGTCRAVIARVAPEVRVIDVTHGMPGRNILAGALILRNTLPYMPERAVHLAVVDPGVGGPRRAIALRSAGEGIFVGPDNGLLTLAAAADGGVAEVHELTNEELWLGPLSATFHGRDIFAPVAARLAAGLPLEVVGRAFDPAELVALELPAPRGHRDGLTATAVLVDRFGNVALNLDAERLEKAGLGETVELLRGSERFLARIARTFFSVRPSDIVILVDSYGQVAVAVNAGSAAEVLGIAPGDEVRLRRLK